MEAFFSGTDTSTLRAEGNDTNCFVSLIVNTAGTYCAAVTRKVKERKLVTTKDLGSSYEFFGEGSRMVASPANEESAKETVEKEVIEYYMMDVQVETIDNPLGYLDDRFVEIEKRKSRNLAVSSRKYQWPDKETISPAVRTAESNYTFRDWMDQREAAGEFGYPPTKEQYLFPEDEMQEMTVLSEWKPDAKTIHHLVCQMVTCSLIVDKNIDLKQWATRWMEKKYRDIFGESTEQLQNWQEFIIEFMINQYNDENTPAKVYDDWDAYQGKVAAAMYDELCCITDDSNIYIEEYKNILSRYIYE